MAESQTEGRKTIKVAESTHRQLESLKPYDSMSFDELIADMAGVYQSARRAP